MTENFHISAIFWRQPNKSELNTNAWIDADPFNQTDQKSLAKIVLFPKSRYNLNFFNVFPFSITHYSLLSITQLLIPHKVFYTKPSKNCKIAKISLTKYPCILDKIFLFRMWMSVQWSSVGKTARSWKFSDVYRFFWDF